MEWVEFTAKTVDDAKALAIEELGVVEEEAEFDVLDEPKQGLFGRVRGEARIRARVKPTPVRAKHDRRRGKRDQAAGADAAAGETASNDKSTKADKPASDSRPARRPRSPKPVADRASSTNGSESSESSSPRPSVSADQVGQEAVKFMDGLVAAFGVEGTSELVVVDDDLEVRVNGAGLGLLVGPRGTTLQAIQDLARVASQRRLGDQDTRLRIDIGGYRERRREALTAFATKMADEVISSGTARVLEPMGSADRKVIHDTLSSLDGVSTRSEGDDPYRRVVIAPA